MESQDLEERHSLARLLQQTLMEESAPKEQEMLPFANGSPVSTVLWQREICRHPSP